MTLLFSGSCFLVWMVGECGCEPSGIESDGKTNEQFLFDLNQTDVLIIINCIEICGWAGIDPALVGFAGGSLCFAVF